MAAAFALGAEGVQMGTRMVSAAESPVHQNWKDMIVNAKETDTVFLNRFGPGPALRALRTEKTTRFEKAPPENIMGEFGNALDLYFGGDMEARSDEHTSELQSLMRISYAVFCLKKKRQTRTRKIIQTRTQ